MQYRIDEKGEFNVVGFLVETDFERAREDVSEVWKKFLSRYREIKNYVGGMKNYGVAVELDKIGRGFRYVACCEVSEFENVPIDMVMQIVSASKYAVFTHKGKLDKLRNTYEKIMSFMRKKGMKRKNYWFEFYDQRYRGDKPESEFEIWVAIE